MSDSLASRSWRRSFFVAVAVVVRNLIGSSRKMQQSPRRIMVLSAWACRKGSANGSGVQSPDREVQHAGKGDPAR